MAWLDGTPLAARMAFFATADRAQHIGKTISNVRNSIGEVFIKSHVATAMMAAIFSSFIAGRNLFWLWITQDDDVYMFVIMMTLVHWLIFCLQCNQHMYVPKREGCMARVIRERDKLPKQLKSAMMLSVTRQQLKRAIKGVATNCRQ